MALTANSSVVDLPFLGLLPPSRQFRPQQQHTPWPAWQCRFHGSRERVCVSLFGKPGLGSWGAGDMLAPQRNLEAEALLEHGFRCKKCAVPSRAG